MLFLSHTKFSVPFSVSFFVVFRINIKRCAKHQSLQSYAFCILLHTPENYKKWDRKRDRKLMGILNSFFLSHRATEFTEAPPNLPRRRRGNVLLARVHRLGSYRTTRQSSQRPSGRLCESAEGTSVFSVKQISYKISVSSVTLCEIKINSLIRKISIFAV